MKSTITPSTGPLMELFYRGLSDPDSEVQCNAAFASGLLVEHSEVDLSPQYTQLLQALHPLFDVPADAPATKFNTRDNAAGAVSRIIVKNSAAVPLGQVLPILLGALPLKNDFLENRPLFRCIFHLFRTNAAILHSYLDGLLQIFAHVLDSNGPDQIGDEIRKELISLVNLLNREEPGNVQAVAGLLPFLG